MKKLPYCRVFWMMQIYARMNWRQRIGRNVYRWHLDTGFLFSLVLIPLNKDLSCILSIDNVLFHFILRGL